MVGEMTRDDIIRMARESGAGNLHGGEWALFGDANIERFFHMAYAAGAAEERNKLAKWMIQHSYATGHGDTMEDLLKELEGQVIAAEREACAQVCLDYGDDSRTAATCAAAIKARGKV
jgi:hypothetical protein